MMKNQKIKVNKDVGDDDDTDDESKEECKKREEVIKNVKNNGSKEESKKREEVIKNVKDGGSKEESKKKEEVLKNTKNNESNNTELKKEDLTYISPHNVSTYINPHNVSTYISPHNVSTYISPHNVSLPIEIPKKVLCDASWNDNNDKEFNTFITKGKEIFTNPIEIKSHINIESPWYEENKELVDIKGNEIAQNLFFNQIKTQEQITFFTSILNNNCISPPIRELTAKNYLGKQIYIPKEFRSFTINDKDGEFGGIVLNKICNNIFCVNSNTTHILITDCHNLNIKVEGKIYAGIECLNSSNITIDVEDQYFFRCITSHGVRLKGSFHDSVILDFRNCLDVKVNGEDIELNEFMSVRYHKNEDDHIVRTPPSTDIFLTEKLSLPNITISK
jgi:hypothetical protein